MRTERDRARSLADVFVGPEMQRELAVRIRGRRSCLRVNPRPVSRCLPWDSPSETIWALWGGENVLRAVIASLRGTLISTWVLFSWCLSRASAPVHRQRLAFGQRRLEFGQRRRRNRRIRRRRFEGGQREGASIKEEESSKEQVYQMFFSYTMINCRCGLAIHVDKPIKQQSLQKHKRGAFFCICRLGDWNFSYTATLATKTFRLLPPWGVLLKRFFEPCSSWSSCLKLHVRVTKNRAMKRQWPKSKLREYWTASSVTYQTVHWRRLDSSTITLARY